MDEPDTRAQRNQRHVPWSRACMRGAGLRIRIEEGPGASRGHRKG